MKYLLFSISLSFFFSSSMFSQNWQQATMSDDMVMTVRKVSPPENPNQSKNTMSQMTGFPIAVIGNASFKNMRNVVLVDLDGDLKQEIIFAADNKLYACSSQGILWQTQLTGTGIYPPSVADINNDGFPEIVQLTGGVPANGRVFVVDKDGNTLPGWPVSFNNNWMICAPALADLNNDGVFEIICCERSSSTTGKIHVLKTDGTSFSSSWPVTIDGVPAVTPSVADVDNDGDKEIVAYSTKSRYILQLNGQPETGFPLTTEPEQKYSYQSPIIADLNNDNQSEIMGSTHGDVPQFYAMTNNGSDFGTWPMTVPDSSWTYSPPTVVKIDGAWKIFMSRPIGSEVEDMLYGWDATGNMLPGYPIVKSGGLEGYISVADINNDSDFELVFGANMLDTDGYGFINAYNAETGMPVSGFPIQPRGWTFMNGVCIGDVNGDDQMDLVALTYTNSFGANTDTVYINVYEMNSPYTQDKVLWGTYKGSNDRSGFAGSSSSNVALTEWNNINVYPNPGSGVFNVETPANMNADDVTIELYNLLGVLVYSAPVNESITKLDLSRFSAGVYMLKMSDGNKIANSRVVKL